MVRTSFTFNCARGPNFWICTNQISAQSQFKQDQDSTRGKCDFGA